MRNYGRRFGLVVLIGDLESVLLKLLIKIVSFTLNPTFIFLISLLILSTP